MSTGTIDEKIYTRQLSKEGLQSRVVDNESEVNSISTRSLKELFYYQVIVMACVRACVHACVILFHSQCFAILASQSDTISGTHEMLRCERCGGSAWEQCARARQREEQKIEAEKEAVRAKRKAKKAKQKTPRKTKGKKKSSKKKQRVCAQ